ncbi:MAG: hypothetical protein KGL59_13010 [Acidobacteriota bacterium]|nr:hypothetical protein [Acidobacteriota bacterium]
MRDKWYCSPRCLLPALERSILELLPAAETAFPHRRRVPIGLLLLQRGVINEDQLRQALALQQEHREGRLGDWLRRIGAASELDITRALAMQWGCPVFPLERDQGYRLCAGLMPLTLCQTHRFLPVFYSADRSLLYLAFTSGVDHAALYGIEQMLACRTLPCIVSESAYAVALADMENSSAPAPEAMIFDSMRDPFEIAHAACGFIQQLEAQSVQLARVGRSLWVRFLCHSGPRDLLFHFPAS